MATNLFRIELAAANLLVDFPPRMRHPHKAALLRHAYPNGRAGEVTMMATRWAPSQLAEIAFERADALPMRLDLRPDFFDYAESGLAASAVEWHVNFADPRLFIAYGSPLLAQDEMQVVEHPLLASVREALLAKQMPALTVDETGPTPILIRNVERRLVIDTSPDASKGKPFGLYGNRFARAPLDVVLDSTRIIDPPTRTHLIAMAAPSGGYGEYAAGEIAFVTTTALTAFEAARMESHGSPVVVQTGFWGCGAFGGNRRLMIALQVLAARAAGIAGLVLHTGDEGGLRDARAGVDIAEGLTRRLGTKTSLPSLVERVAILGLRWGASDGN
jgi:hypothetical protein